MKEEGVAVWDCESTFCLKSVISVIFNLGSGKNTFKNISLLTKTYLCASAASVPVEQMFSSTGLMLNSKRSSMAHYRANIVCVIHDNYAKFFPITRDQANVATRQ
jgi:hypothetical protein